VDGGRKPYEVEVLDQPGILFGARVERPFNIRVKSLKCMQLREGANVVHQT